MSFPDLRDHGRGGGRPAVSIHDHDMVRVHEDRRVRVGKTRGMRESKVNVVGNLLDIEEIGGRGNGLRLAPGSAMCGDLEDTRAQ